MTLQKTLKLSLTKLRLRAKALLGVSWGAPNPPVCGAVTINALNGEGGCAGTPRPADKGGPYPPETEDHILVKTHSKL